MRKLAALFVLATSCAAPSMRPAAPTHTPAAAPSETPAVSAPPSPLITPSPVSTIVLAPTAQPTRSPAPTPALTPAPDARTIGRAFTFKEGDRWVLGYVDSRRGLVFMRESRVPDVRGALPVTFSEITFVDPGHGWAVGRVMEAGLVPGCQHAGTTCHDVIASTVDGGRAWKIVRSVYTTGVTGDTFHGLQFVDALHGWTAQYIDGCSESCAGELLATDDGGATWTVRSRAKGVFAAFNFVDERHGWAIETDWWTYYDAIGPATRLLATSDGGRTWSRALEGAPVYDIAALDRAHAWAIARQTTCGPTCKAEPVQLYRTTDGEHWSLAVRDLSAQPCIGNDMYAPAFVDAARGVIASGGRELGDSGGVLVTDDGGVTWACATAQPSPANAHGRPLALGGSVALVTSGRDGSDHVMVTPDIGTHWSERALP